LSTGASQFRYLGRRTGQHYYTRLLHHAALADGALWMREAGMNDDARPACLSAAQEIAQSSIHIGA